MAIRTFGLAATAIAALGCHHRMSEQVVQPNPLASPRESLKVSEPVTVTTGDMDLEVPVRDGSGRSWRYPLRHVAQFKIVSRDRLRFHIMLQHKWKEWTDLSSWKPTLVVDGREYAAEEVDPREGDHKVVSWNTSEIVGGDIANRRPQATSSITVFRGWGDAVFYHRPLITPETSTITLRLERDRTTLAFTWRFEDQGDGGDRQAGSAGAAAR